MATDYKNPTPSQQLQQAKDNLDRIREEYRNEPDLLAIYEPSARYLVEKLEAIIESEVKTNGRKQSN